MRYKSGIYTSTLSIPMRWSANRSHRRRRSGHNLMQEAVTRLVTNCPGGLGRTLRSTPMADLQANPRRRAPLHHGGLKCTGPTKLTGAEGDIIPIGCCRLRLSEVCRTMSGVCQTTGQDAVK